jgi:hypothetical protein
VSTDECLVILFREAEEQLLAIYDLWPAACRGIE